VYNYQYGSIDDTRYRKKRLGSRSFSERCNEAHMPSVVTHAVVQHHIRNSAGKPGNLNLVTYSLISMLVIAIIHQKKKGDVKERCLDMTAMPTFLHKLND